MEWEVGGEVGVEGWGGICRRVDCGVEKLIEGRGKERREGGRVELGERGRKG